MIIPPPQAVAVIGLVLLSSGKRVIDLGTIASANVDDSGAAPVLHLRVHGQSTPERLEGDDAIGIWAALSGAATPTKSLIPAPPVPLIPVEPIVTVGGPIPPESATGGDNGLTPLSITGSPTVAADAPPAPAPALNMVPPGDPVTVPAPAADTAPAANPA